MSEPLAFTGERFIPGAAGEIWYEHWHRYHFAANLVGGREVLDVACGAGYGSALLARQATRVTGVDLSLPAIEHAHSTYAGVPNLEFRQADCTALPFADASFDAVVSFETIEHIEGQEPFLDEIRRVLRPAGLLVLSCPNKLEYSDRRGCTNQYHVRELYRAELEAMLAARFRFAQWFGQRMSFSLVWPEGESPCADLFEVSESAPETASPGHARPLYFIVTASNDEKTMTSVAPRLSVLADRDEWVQRDYLKTIAELERQWQRGKALDDLVAQWQQRHAEAIRERDALAAAQARQSKSAAQGTAAVELEAARTEIARRASFRWWLALPLRRLRNAIRGAPPSQ